MMKKKVLKIKPYSTTELSMFYGICTRTFKLWIEPFNDKIGKRQGRFYTTLQVDIIVNALGLPYNLEEELQ